VKANRNRQTAPFSSADFIVRHDGSAYHLGLRPGELATTIIIVGDPDRVGRVSARFDSIEVSRQTREFVTHTGTFRSHRISVISSGIGADNIDILINECDMLHNADFAARMLRPDPVSLRFIRLGTSGSIRPEILPGSLLRADWAFGSDGLPWFCNSIFEDEEMNLSREFGQQVHWPEGAARPYFVKAPGGLANLFSGEPYVRGLTATMNGFYSAQGRFIGLRPFHSEFICGLAAARLKVGPITNLEMETAAIYAYASMLGHEAISLLAILANRINGTFADDMVTPVENLIDNALDRLTLAV
jgi:uridine phosphorylase